MREFPAQMQIVFPLLDYAKRKHSFYGTVPVVR